MGIEKLIPRAEDLGVFVRLLARSATGQAITAYTSHYHGPRPGAELHIVLVDNGRTSIRQEPRHQRALSCIRCGACMNTCPVYRRSGGHSYGTHVPGPIGSILAPLGRPHEHRSLPHACSLCGSCSNVCPVKINLHEQLLELRERPLEGSAHEPAPRGAWRERALAMLGAWLLSRPRLFAWLSGLLRKLGARFPALLERGPLARWTQSRDLPRLPSESFRELYARREPRGA